MGVLLSCHRVGRQAPVTRLCTDDGRTSQLLAQTKANSAVFCHFPVERAEVYGKGTGLDFKGSMRSVSGVFTLVLCTERSPAEAL